MARQHSSLLLPLLFFVQEPPLSHLNVVLSLGFSASRIHHIGSNYGAFYGPLSHTRIHAHTYVYNGSHTWLKLTWVDLTTTSTAVNLSCCRSTRWILGFFSEIDHDGAGYGYLGTSIINVEGSAANFFFNSSLSRKHDVMTDVRVLIESQ